MTAEPMLTTAEVAAELRCDPDTVLRAIARGHLPAVKYGRLVRIRRAALDDFLAAHDTGNQLAGRRQRRAS